MLLTDPHPNPVIKGLQKLPVVNANHTTNAGNAEHHNHIVKYPSVIPKSAATNRFQGTQGIQVLMECHHCNEEFSKRDFNWKEYLYDKQGQ